MSMRNANGIMNLTSGLTIQMENSKSLADIPTATILGTTLPKTNRTIFIRTSTRQSSIPFKIMRTHTDRERQRL